MLLIAGSETLLKRKLEQITLLLKLFSDLPLLLVCLLGTSVILLTSPTYFVHFFPLLFTLHRRA